MPLASAPLEALAAFVFIVSGLPVYYVTQYHSHAGDWLRGMWGGGGGGKGQSTAGYQPTSQHEEEVPMAER